jgi:O-succinylbenzoate synthase
VLTIGSNNFTNAVDTAYYVVDNVNNINTNITTVLSTLSMFTTKTAIKITPDNVIYTFEIDSGIASVISSPSALGDIQILQSFVVNSVTYNVTSIASSAFNNCAGITRVTIPSSVLTIGELLHTLI